MKILDESFVRNQLAQWAKDDYPLTLYQEMEARELFYDLMREKQNINKDIPTQEALLAEIARKLSYGETRESVFRQHGDNKHLNYFDVFLEEGASKNILDALNYYGISTDVLKGIKKNVPFDAVIDGVRVVQEISNGDDGSPTVEKFEITKDGKLVYFWTPRRDYVSYFDDEYYDETELEQEKPAPPKQPPKTKSGKPRKGTYLATIISSSGEEITKEVMSNGRVAYRASNGRFTKK